MKTLIIGAGPLGSLYTYLLHKAGNDVTILARNEHYKFLQKNGLVLVNEFTKEKIIEKVKLVNSLNESDFYDLVIVLMRKNSVKNVLPTLRENKKIQNFLFMGNNAFGFDQYLNYLPTKKVLFGFPGGGGTRKNHITHFIDSEKPNGKRLPITIGEIDGKIKVRTKQIQELFESSDVPVNIVRNIDGWLKYHSAYVVPLAGALLKTGDNYKLADDKNTIRTYIRAVKEVGKALFELGYDNQLPAKIKSFYWNPEWITIRILKLVFKSKFAEIAMMMHVNSAKDEMLELGYELIKLKNQTLIKTPNLEKLVSCIK
ncbi:MAG: ketopantoate reductase family protein [Ignavibacteriae bacterium]|nr:ketopantoate reductase family protein [Ignavibacteriota bacterium]